jgi:hypothetical protein
MLNRIRTLKDEAIANFLLFGSIGALVMGAFVKMDFLSPLKALLGFVAFIFLIFLADAISA